MLSQAADIVVAGHICLDVIPELRPETGSLRTLMTPGTLIEVGPAKVAPGGAVSNTGRALHRLGLIPHLVGRVGDDMMGRMILGGLQEHDETLTEGVMVAEGEVSSYTLVISPPEVDRIFLHCPGANATFQAREVPLDRLRGARLFHFGYPPAMRAVYADGGEQLAWLFEEVRAREMVTSLDMSHPDPGSEAGNVDWAAWLARVLPHVDVFGPNFEEILFMLDRPLYEGMMEGGGEKPMTARADTTLLDRLGRRLIELGASLVAIKLGDQGLYLRTARDAASLTRLEKILALDPRRWHNRQLLIPALKADVVGTTGAGDATMAGFLSSLHHGLVPEAALQRAAAVGAFSVEAADATSAVPDWRTVQSRLRAGWTQRPLEIARPGWSKHKEYALWTGPDDRA